MSVLTDMQAGIWPDASAPAAAAIATIDAQSSSPIFTIPGIPPIVLTIESDLTIVYDVYQIIHWILLLFDGSIWGAVISLIIEVVLQILPSLMGRPHEQATMWCANNLLKSKNSAGVIAGNNILRAYQQWGIVISESGPGEAIVAAIVSQFVTNLTGQGLQLARARAIVLDQFTLGANQKAYLTPELGHAAQPNLTISGPQGLQAIWSALEAHFLGQGLSTTAAGQRAFRLLLQYTPLRWLVRLRIGHQPTPVPVPPPPPPPIPPGPQPGPIPLPPPPDPNGDELTDCCNLTATYLYYVATAIQGFTPSGNGGSDACCASIVTAIGSVASALATIAAAIPSASGGGPPPDLSAIVGQLTDLVIAVNGLPAADNAGADKIAAAIDALREALPAPAPDPNVKRIADTLNGAPLDVAVGQSKIDEAIQYAIDNLGFPAALAQIITS